MSTKIDDIIDDLKSLTLLEAAELVKKIEETFDVDASLTSQAQPIVMPLGGENSTTNEAEEKTEFDLILEEVPAAKKIAILKVVRSMTGLGLKEAKDLVESAPKTIKEGITKESSEEMKKQLEDAGAKVTIK
uniref:50S ribosomal protein L12, chloroplastic n=2 Tax=Gracilariopsis TaxID=2781 RepID=A0A1C9CF68_9FLOR|nr:ribosomal protein L12 [Gracilariopsis lemaneiformis]YP_009294749.1 ribosomal protein L12 [Gracilariopsis chorda]AJO68390.1 ribosomal protein L12 [Gracilariopsis lemaneiformis]AML79878.1 ribosomal protein L12 [Gracilariopsis lemaneiformis]AOM67009.1 ribosomal protein L12 [Gracilariopsis chorda]UAD88933.1 ribosomal protein L12 [Gracilariopsis chorda]